MTISPGSELSEELKQTSVRHRSRERALGLLYEAETKKVTPAVVLSELITPAEPYASVLITGVNAKYEEIDLLIGKHAQAWSIDRMPPIDRNILRLSTYELILQHDVPTAVVIDEAVELAKEYSTEDSGRYVNGVLSAIAAEVRPGDAAK